MANLLDVHAPIEADLLACVAFRPDASLIVPQIACRHWRMMRDLLRYQSCAIFPLREKQLA